MLYRRSLFVSFIAALALALPSVASAQSSLESGYDPQSGESQAGVSRDEGGALPFTGSNLYIWAGLGLMLLGAGVALRRTAEPHAAGAGQRRASGRPSAPVVRARKSSQVSRTEEAQPAGLEPTELAFEEDRRKKR